MIKCKRLISMLLAFVLAATMTLSGCKKEDESSSQPASSEPSSSQSSVPESSSSSESAPSSSEAAGPLPGVTESVSSEVSSSQIVASEPVCNQPGYYTAQESLSSLKVTVGSVLLQNKVIDGDLEITADALHDPITLSNVTVGGRLIIRGGGIVTLEDVRAATLYAQKEEEPIYLLLQGAVEIPQAMIGGEMIMLDGGLTSTGIPEIFLEQVDSNAEAGKSVLELQGVSVSQLVTSQESEVMLYDGASVDTAWANAPTRFQGTGKIETLNCTSAGVTYQTAPGKIQLQEGIAAPTAEVAVSSSVVRIPTSSSSSSGSAKVKYYVTKNGIRVYPLDSSKSEGSASMRLEEPEIEIDEENNRLYISWDRVRNASGYRVELREGVGTGKLLESAKLDKSETSYKTDYTVDWDTDYTIRVKALASGDYIDSGYGEMEYNSSYGDFGSPKELKLRILNGHFEAEWKHRDEADYYEVYLYDPDGEILEDTTTELNYFWFEDIEIEEIGRYAVKVRGVNLDTGEYSAFASVSYRVSASDRKVDTPTVFAEFVDDTLVVSWDWIDNVKNYTLQIRMDGSKSYLKTNVSTTENEYIFDSINFKKGNKYVVEVRANAESGYSNSDYASFTTDYYKVGW